MGRSIGRVVDGTDISEIFFGAPFLGADANRGLAFITNGNVSHFAKNDGTVQFQQRPTHLGAPLATKDELDKRAPWYTPEMFGAVGDGVTDDSNAFDAMMSAIPGTGPSMIVLSRAYYLSRQWKIAKNAIKVMGIGAMPYIEGHGARIIFKDNNFDGIMIGTDLDTPGVAGSAVVGIELENFQVIMRTCTDSTRFAAVVAGASHVLLHRIRFLGSDNNSINQCGALWFRDGQSLTLDDVYMYGFTGDQVFLQSAALQSTVQSGDSRWIYGTRRPDTMIASGCRFAGTKGNTRTQAVRMGGAHRKPLEEGEIEGKPQSFGSSMFLNCTTVFCKSHYVLEKAHGDLNIGLPSFFYILGKGGEGASSDYVRLVHGHHAIINSAYFGTANDSASEDGDSGGAGIVVESTFGGPVVVTGSYVKATASHVVHIKGGRDIQITGNTFGRAGVGGTQVASNIRVESGAAEVGIVGNNLTNLVPGKTTEYAGTRYGIDCVSNDSVLITGNRCGGALGGIRHKTGTNILVANNLGSVVTYT